MHALVEAGSDIIELGMPFSDPMADGPMIQRANDRALARGVDVAAVFGFVAEFRRTDSRTPIVLMGYANPIEAMGPELFLRRAADAGVDGLIVVDYPPEEASAFAKAARAGGIDPIFLLSPTTSAERARMVIQHASGYLYYVSLTGITGAGHLNVDEVAKRVAELKRDTALPIGVGFGIRDSASATAVARAADAVVIGSRLLQVLEDGSPDDAPSRAREFLAPIRRALDAMPKG